MSHGKVMIINLIVGLTKKMLLNKMSSFPEPYTHSKKKQNKNRSWNRFVWLWNKT